MAKVYPIKDIDTVLDIADYLKSQYERNYVMFMTGIYSGLRVSDILPLRVRDVKGKEYIHIYEQKTGKENRFIINDELKEILEEYIRGMKDYEFLFKSRKGYNKPITPGHAYKILREAGEKFGIESLGTHSMRKTFGYLSYQKTKDAVTIQKIFNHSDMSYTLRYIGIHQEEKDTFMKKFSLKKR